MSARVSITVPTAHLNIEMKNNTKKNMNMLVHVLFWYTRILHTAVCSADTHINDKIIWCVLMKRDMPNKNKAKFTFNHLFSYSS